MTHLVLDCFRDNREVRRFFLYYSFFLYLYRSLSVPFCTCVTDSLDRPVEPRLKDDRMLVRLVIRVLSGSLRLGIYSVVSVVTTNFLWSRFLVNEVNRFASRSMMLPLKISTHDSLVNSLQMASLQTHFCCCRGIDAWCGRDKNTDRSKGQGRLYLILCELRNVHIIGCKISNICINHLGC